MDFGAAVTTMNSLVSKTSLLCTKFKICFSILIILICSHTYAGSNLHLLEGVIQADGKKYPVYVKTECTFKRLGIDGKDADSECNAQADKLIDPNNLPERHYTTTFCLMIAKKLRGNEATDINRPITIRPDTFIDSISNTILQEAFSYRGSPLEWLLKYAPSSQDLNQDTDEWAWLILRINHTTTKKCKTLTDSKSTKKTQKRKKPQDEVSTDFITITAGIKSEANRKDVQTTLQEDASLEIGSISLVNEVSVWQLLHDRMTQRSFSKQKDELLSEKHPYTLILFGAEECGIELLVDEDQNKIKAEIGAYHNQSRSEKTTFKLRGTSELASQAESIKTLLDIFETATPRKPPRQPHSTKKKSLHGSSRSLTHSSMTSLLSTSTTSLNAREQISNIDISDNSLPDISSPFEKLTLMENPQPLTSLTPFYMWSYLYGTQPVKVTVFIDKLQEGPFNCIQFDFDQTITSSTDEASDPVFKSSFPALSVFSINSGRIKKPKDSALHLSVKVAHSNQATFATSYTFSYFPDADNEDEPATLLGKNILDHGAFLTYMNQFSKISDIQAPYMQTDFSQEQLDVQKIRRREQGHATVLYHDKIPLGYQTTYQLQERYKQILVWTRLSGSVIDSLYQDYFLQSETNADQHKASKPRKEPTRQEPSATAYTSGNDST